MRPSAPVFFERTFFVTTVTHERRRLFAVTSRAELMLATLVHYRKGGAFELHAFVIMPDHLHLLLTPAPTLSLEGAVQRVKGGFSYRARKTIRGPIWQASFVDHRIRDLADFASHAAYVHANPVRRGLCASPELYRFSSAALPELMGWNAGVKTPAY